MAALTPFNGAGIRKAGQARLGYCSDDLCLANLCSITGCLTFEHQPVKAPPAASGDHKVKSHAEQGDIVLDAVAVADS